MKILFLLISLMPLTVWGVCEESFVQVGEKCLYFETEYDFTSAEADEYCYEMYGGGLATITNARQFKAMIDYIYNNGLAIYPYWVDGSDKGSEGTWLSSAGGALPMGTPFWAGFPKFQEPNNGDGKIEEDCLQLNTFYYLNDVPCDDRLKLVCEQGNDEKSFHNKSNVNGACPMHSVEIGDKCLTFMTWETVTWPEARIICNGRNEELAIIDDIELLRALSLYIQEQGFSSYNFWLGASDEAQEGVWKWVDGSDVPMGSPFWGLGDSGQEPDGHTSEKYLSILAEGYHYFRDVSDKNTLHPLCQITI